MVTKEGALSMHQSILLVEDSQDYQELALRTLKSEYQVSVVATLEEASRKLDIQEFDLILLDVELPDGDGFKYCASLQNREGWNSAPILFLTGRSEMADLLTGFSLGGEDYIVKPFDPCELQARVRARLRVRNEMRSQQEIVRKGTLLFKAATQDLFITTPLGDRRIDLTPAEFKILFLLARNEKKAFSRDEIVSSVWGHEVHVTPRTVDTHISNLRRKLPLDSCSIKPIRALGYIFSLGPTNEESLAL